MSRKNRRIKIYSNENYIPQNITKLYKCLFVNPASPPVKTEAATCNWDAMNSLQNFSCYCIKVGEGSRMLRRLRRPVNTSKLMVRRKKDTFLHRTKVNV